MSNECKLKVVICIRVECCTATLYALDSGDRPKMKKKKNKKVHFIWNSSSVIIMIIMVRTFAFFKYIFFSATDNGTRTII